VDLFCAASADHFLDVGTHRVVTAAKLKNRQAPTLSLTKQYGFRQAEEGGGIGKG
jgi:hypothetical protein